MGFSVSEINLENDLALSFKIKYEHLLQPRNSILEVVNTLEKLFAQVHDET